MVQGTDHNAIAVLAGVADLAPSFDVAAQALMVSVSMAW